MTTIEYPPKSYSKLSRKQLETVAIALEEQRDRALKALEPRQVTTVDELEGLQDPATILVDYTGHPYQWDIGMDGSEGWITTHDHAPITSRHLWRFTPITVLRSPVVTP